MCACFGEDSRSKHEVLFELGVSLSHYESYENETSYLMINPHVSQPFFAEWVDIRFQMYLNG